MAQQKQATLPLIDGIPDIWVTLRLEVPMTPREFRFAQTALAAKMQEWLQEIAPGKGTLTILPGHEVAAWAQEHVAEKVGDLMTVLQRAEKPESLRIAGVIQELLRQDAATIRKANEEGLANLEPGGPTGGTERG